MFLPEVPIMEQTLTRTTFITSRLLEFFSEKELQMQIGHPRVLWPVALVKELIDNALDVCESAGTQPQITITVGPDAVQVRDNGPGLPLAVLDRSLDYLVRVSDKAHYVSPSRGQLGNALKCVWAAPFVMSGDYGRVDVATAGTEHQITVRLDRIAQLPQLARIEAPSDVKSGTAITMYWPHIASYLDFAQRVSFYKQPNLWLIVNSYAAFNPHASFTVVFDTAEPITWPSTAPDWPKWLPSDPTSPHWYTVERVRALIVAYLADEQASGRARTVREFVAEFAGLSGSAKQKTVTDAANLTNAYLHDLARDGDIDRGAVTALLEAMQSAARPIKPHALGTLGEAHLAAHMVRDRYAHPDSIRYKKIEGDDDGLPFVIEVAFGVYTREYQSCDPDIAIGLNWSPSLSLAPIRQLSQILGEQRIDSHDPIVLLIHLAGPRLDFTDRGKTVLALSECMLTVLDRAIREVTKEWKNAKRQADQTDRVRERELAELRKEQKRQVVSIKDAATAVMQDAYLKASANGTLPANARQVMYAARPLVLSLTGGRCWKESSYFTQHLLPDYMEANPDLTRDWDVVFDARGHLVEPHTGQAIDLGTLGVRRYIDAWATAMSAEPNAIALDYASPTSGPAHRYTYALFVEKEGFNELLRRARIAERYDLAIMSTKGMSVTAARTLVERLSLAGVTILVMHDFDKSGFSIVHTLRTDTRRFRYNVPPRIIDLGLRLDDVQTLQLESEPVEYDGKIDPRINVRDSGATPDEAEYLVQSSAAPWHGARVELNAMTSDQFVTWLTHKLEQHGVGKVVPSAVDLMQAYRRARKIAAVQRAVSQALAAYQDDDAVPPDNLHDQVAAVIEGTDSAWDAALWQLAQQNEAA
jgi:DNA topoisomerase VI subunit B